MSTKYSELFKIFLSKYKPVELIEIRDMLKLGIPRTTLYRMLNKKIELKEMDKAYPGLYYKTEFLWGKKNMSVPPSLESLIEKLFNINGEKPKAYLTGYMIYNGFGLTPQVPAVSEYASEKTVKNNFLKKMRVEFRKSKAPITKTNIFLLQLLDCIEKYTGIMGFDSKVDLLNLRLSKLLDILSLDKKDEIIRLSKYYKLETQARLEKLLNYEESMKGEL